MPEEATPPQGEAGDKQQAPPATEQPPTANESSPGDEAAKWKALARKHEQQAKANAEKASQFDKLQESNKSEAQKQADRIAELERENAEVKLARLREQVARDKKLPPEWAAVLNGATAEEMGEHADALKASVERDYAPKQAPAPQSTGAGATGDGKSSASDPDSLARAVLGR